MKKKATAKSKGRRRQATTAIIVATATTVVSGASASDPCMVREFTYIQTGAHHTELAASAMTSGNSFNTTEVARLLAKLNEVHRVQKTPLVFINKTEDNMVICHEIVTDQRGRPQLVPFTGKTTSNHCIICRVDHGGIPI